MTDELTTPNDPAAPLQPEAPAAPPPIRARHVAGVLGIVTALLCDVVALALFGVTLQALGLGSREGLTVVSAAVPLIGLLYVALGLGWLVFAVLGWVLKRPLGLPATLYGACSAFVFAVTMLQLGLIPFLAPAIATAVGSAWATQRAAAEVARRRTAALRKKRGKGKGKSSKAAP